MRFAAVILAAGSGSRIGGEPKQWRVLGGRPVIRWSVDALAFAGAERLVVVVPEADVARAGAALKGLHGVTVIPGGAERAQSARAGLDALADAPPEAVLIHDAARPFVARRHVETLLEALQAADGAIPTLAVSDTLKRQAAEGLATVPRDGLLRAQTPQAFRYAAIQAAFAADTAAGATDDAAVLEQAGGRVAAVEGDPLLMKLTYAEDFAMAEALAGASRVTRVGQGFDVHAFGPGESVWLCGVRIAHEAGLVGHSDADVGLHALTDALLGAIGAGDIGDHFPPSDPQWRGAASDQFLRHAAGMVSASGGEVINVDVTLVCETPRIKPRREEMRRRLAELLQLPLDRISVKATTTEGLGFTGRREGVAAQAVATVSTPR